MRPRLAVLVAALALASSAVGPAVASAPPQYVETFVGPGLADTYPVDVASTDTSYLVLDAGRYRVVRVDRGTGQIVDEFGGHQGKSTSRIGAARAIALDGAGNVYIADTASNRIVKLDASLTYDTAWGTRGSGPGEFNQDYGVAVGPRSGSEVVYVTDGTPGRVQVFSKTGTLLDSFGQGVIDKPRQLTVDPTTEFVYVVSAGPKRIDVFDHNGNARFSFGSKGQGLAQFSQDPRGISIWNGYAFVSDPGKDRIQVWDVSSGTAGTHVCNFGSGSQLTDVRGISIADDGILVATDEWGFGLDEYDVTSVAISGGCLGVTHPRALFGSAPPVPGVNSPRGMAVDGSGRVFITDWWNQRIERHDADGSNPITWGFRGTPQQPGSINFAWDVAVQPGTGNVFVANRESNEIEAFSGAGTFLGRYGKVGSGVGQFRFPQGLAFGPTGLLYVADSSNNRVQRCTVTLGSGLSLSCTVLAGTGASGTTTFNVPTGIDVAGDGTVWVADTQNNRIQRRDTDGSWTSIGTPSGGTKFKLPWGVTVAPDGSIWVADSGNNRIVKMSAGGAQDFAFSGSDVGAGAFDRPFDVEFSGANVYVADVWNNRVVRLQ